MDLNKLYEDNGDFRRYVDKYTHYAEAATITVQEALQHKLVKKLCGVSAGKGGGICAIG